MTAPRHRHHRIDWLGGFFTIVTLAWLVLLFSLIAAATRWLWITASV